MIEINLIPDVKRELLKVRRTRGIVISISTILSIAAVACVALVAAWMLVQATRDVFLQGEIKKQTKLLTDVESIDEAVTLQNQLTMIDKLHLAKATSSRVFDILAAINPAAPNNIGITDLTVDTVAHTVKIQGQAAAGYGALETFHKTIDATSLKYKQADSDTQVVPLAKNIEESDRSFGDSADGQKVLRFTLTFEYDPYLTASDVTEVYVISPVRGDKTDSFVGIPSGIFTEKAKEN